MATKKPVSDYSESSIRVLKGTGSRSNKDPGMYTRTENPLHIIQEVIDNASDEALGGHCKNILRHRQCRTTAITVEDDGRGIPVGLHPEEQRAGTVEIVFTRLHAGGKFDKGSGGAYAFSGGLHGVGVSVTNALSSNGWKLPYGARMTPATATTSMTFANGDVIEPLTSDSRCAKRRQEIRHPRHGIWPDAEVFRLCTGHFTPRNCSGCCVPRLYCCRASRVTLANRQDR